MHSELFFVSGKSPVLSWTGDSLHFRHIFWSIYIAFGSDLTVVRVQSPSVHRDMGEIWHWSHQLTRANLSCDLLPCV